MFWSRTGPETTCSRQSRQRLVDYLLMARANLSKSRGLPAALVTVGLALLGSSAAHAQGPVSTYSAALDPAVPAAPPSFDTELEKAEALFRSGDAALREGREAEAQASFDAALDLFAAFKDPQDPRVRKAYLGMLDQIHAAEISAGSGRRFLPPTQTLQPTEPAEPAEPGSTSVLAEMGERIESLQPTDEARQSNAAVLGSEEIDLPIEMNDQVVSAINLYSGRFKNWFARALSRGLPHLPRIRQILAEAGIPQDLAYVPIVESAFNPVALSRAKAKGLWQFIPSTGKQYGLKQDFFVDERSNMEKATVAAARYLKNLYAMFGDWNLALAGYNAGEGRVQRAIKKARTDDFWALAKTRSFRAETKNYVPLIHAAIVIAKSPEAYGIELAPEETMASETIRVAASYPIATVARCGSTEPEAIKALNPELRRAVTPSFAFDLRVPHGAGEQITTCLASERSMAFTRHVVRKRETFGQIARAFGVPAAEIARVNGLTLKSKLRPGTELAIPRSGSGAGRKTATAGKTSPGGPTSYRIRKGDTLSHVAARHSTTVAAIKALNNLNSNKLSIGQILMVGVASETSND